MTKPRFVGCVRKTQLSQIVVVSSVVVMMVVLGACQLVWLVWRKVDRVLGHYCSALPAVEHSGPHLWMRQRLELVVLWLSVCQLVQMEVDVQMVLFAV